MQTFASWRPEPIPMEAKGTIITSSRESRTQMPSLNSSQHFHAAQICQLSFLSPSSFSSPRSTLIRKLPQHRFYHKCWRFMHSQGFTAAGQASYCTHSSSHTQCSGVQIKNEELEISILNLLMLSLASPAQHSVTVLSRNSDFLIIQAFSYGWWWRVGEDAVPQIQHADSARWGSRASCKQPCSISCCYRTRTSAGNMMSLIIHNSHTVFIYIHSVTLFYQRVNKYHFSPRLLRTVTSRDANHDVHYLSSLM